MEKNSVFAIKEDGEDILFIRTETSRFSKTESLGQYRQFQGEMAQTRNNTSLLQKAIESGQPAKDLEAAQTALAQLEEVNAEWKRLNEPLILKHKEELRKELKVLKAEKGYDRAKEDKNLKVVLMNQIMASACVKTDTPMDSPAVMELKAEFDKI